MGLADSLSLGNINISRDWGYAPRYVEAMWLMLQQPKPDDYLVCSGETHSLGEFTRKVFEKLDLNYEKFVRIDEGLIRPVDLETISGDNSKARRDLGWDYALTLDDLITLLIEDETAYLNWDSNGGA